MNVLIPVGIGELYDKISILELKSERIPDPAKLAHVHKELSLLKEAAKQFPIDGALYDELKKINGLLWDVEDSIRIEESQHRFLNDFVQLARKVYALNDERGNLKGKINAIAGSDIVEVKLYKG